MNVPYNYNEFVFRAGLKRVKPMRKNYTDQQIDRSIFKVKQSNERLE